MKTALIVGASRGLGRALAIEHLARGWRVIATVRDPVALTDVEHDALEIERLDIADMAGMDALRGRLEGRTLDLLFVNSGIPGDMKSAIGQVDPAAFDEIMRVNALGPLRLVDRFADLVPADGMAAVMSSGLGSIADNKTGGWESYRMSKAALDMGLRSLAVRRAAEGRTYLAVCPGWVRTAMGGPGAALAIEDSVPRLVDMLEARRGRGGVAFVNYQDRELAW